MDFTIKWRNPWPKEAGFSFAFLGVWHLKFAGGGRTFGFEVLGVKFEWRQGPKLFQGVAQQSVQTVRRP